MSYQNQHVLSGTVCAYTRYVPDIPDGEAPGWYGCVADDAVPGDIGTDDIGPYSTEAECLAALRDLWAELQQAAADMEDEMRFRREAEKPRTWHVWGCGAARSALISEAEFSDAAAQTALYHGFDLGTEPERWAAEVEASEADIEAATRYDAAVVGYTEGTPEIRNADDAWETWIAQSVTEFLAESEGQTPEEAVEEYCSAIVCGLASRAARDELGRGPTPRERALLVEYAKRHAPVPPSELVGVTEVAAILGWPRAKVSTYHARGVLPRPVKVLAGGPIWNRQDITEYRDKTR